jgi:ankyrin repeat protein
VCCNFQQLLIDYSATLEIRDNKGFTAFSLAALNRDYWVVKALVKNKANINILDNIRCTLLITVSGVKVMSTTALLLRFSANINTCNFKKQSAVPLRPPISPLANRDTLLANKVLLPNRGFLLANFLKL